MEGLEDEADVLVAHLCQIVIAQILQVPAFQNVAPRGWHIQTANDVHQGGFAGAGGAHDGKIVPLFHGEIDIFQHPHRLPALLVVLADVL